MSRIVSSSFCQSSCEGKWVRTGLTCISVIPFQNRPLSVEAQSFTESVSSSSHNPQASITRLQTITANKYHDRSEAQAQCVHSWCETAHFLITKSNDHIISFSQLTHVKIAKHRLTREQWILASCLVWVNRNCYGCNLPWDGRSSHKLLSNYR